MRSHRRRELRNRDNFPIQLHTLVQLVGFTTSVKTIFSMGNGRLFAMH